MIVLLAALSCPVVKPLNKTDLPWVKHDWETYVYCQRRCPQLYSDAPCLTRFEKFGFQAYTCICGAKQ